MNRIKDILPYSWTLIIATISIFWISFLFPESGRFQYEFQKGFVWSYPDLFAPFDFPISKSAEELDQERSELTDQITPFYKWDNNILQEVTQVVNEDISNWVKNAVEVDTSFLIEWELKMAAEGLLKELYSNLVGPINKEHQNKEAISLIRKDNTIRNIKPGSILAISDTKSRIDAWTPLIPDKYLTPLKSILKSNIRPSIEFDVEKTANELNDQLAQINDKKGLIRKGELIIPRGAVVSDQQAQVLSSLKDQYSTVGSNSKSQWWVFTGFILLTILIIGVYLLYLWNHNKNILKSPREISFLFMWFIVFSYLVYAMETQVQLSSYILPFCIVPIVIKNYYNERLAFFTHVVVILIASFLSNLGYEFTFLQILAGIVTVLTVKDTREWSEFFKTILLIFGTYILGFAGLELIKNGGVELFDTSALIWLSVNAFLILLAYPLIPLLERIFGFISSITLVELGDLNKPLLRELSLKAPGTFQHSLQVGNIAEDAATEINANGLLVKTAALYHDIGKMNNPDYFIENQTGTNPHKEEDLKRSAEIIIKHVTEGAEMAKRAGLPKIIISFILTHHGTTRVEYFYRKYLEAHPDVVPTDIQQQFTYPGPRPVTKEQCVLMMADSLEAAAKSLPSPSAEALDTLVDDIVDQKIRLGQFSEADITFAELETCKRSFKKSLKSIHHVRIAYPKEPGSND